MQTFVCCEPGCWVETCAGKYCSRHGGHTHEIRDNREMGDLARKQLRREAAQQSHEGNAADLKAAALERLQSFKDSRSRKPRDERRASRPLNRAEFLERVAELRRAREPQ